MPLPSPWEPEFRNAASLGCKVSIVAPDGTCLAIANWQAALVEHWPAIEGKRWHEYISPQDLHRLLAWFAPGTDDLPPIIYEGLGRVDGKDQPVLVCLVKTWLPCGVWLVIGDQRPARAVPASGPWP